MSHRGNGKRTFDLVPAAEPHLRSAQVWRALWRDLTVLLPLSSRLKLVLIYRLRRDGRLSWPVCLSVQIEQMKQMLEVMHAQLANSKSAARSVVNNARWLMSLITAIHCCSAYFTCVTTATILDVVCQVLWETLPRLHAFLAGKCTKSVSGLGSTSAPPTPPPSLIKGAYLHGGHRDCMLVPVGWAPRKRTSICVNFFFIFFSYLWGNEKGAHFLEGGRRAEKVLGMTLSEQWEYAVSLMT